MSVYRVGVIGYPISHSLSPAMHNAAFAALGMTGWQYDALPIPPDIIGLSLRTLREEGGYIGVNVTVPHKQAAMQYTRPDEVARAVGAVNTITFETLIATNTDVAGFMDDLTAHEVDVSGRRVIVLGAGGAARAAIYGLARAGAVVAAVNRTKTRAQEVIANLALSAGINGIEVMTLDEAGEWQPEVMINCTSVGMHPYTHETPWIEGVPFPRNITVYDMVYRPEKTLFLQQAEANDCRAVGGLGMLVRQGAAAFKIWTGVDAPVEVMESAARRVLAGE
jgi:shikimate dehydrogenase